MERKRFYCPHCEYYVSRSFYYSHKHLYYDETSQQWSNQTSNVQAPAVGFEFSPEHDSDESDDESFEAPEGIEEYIGHTSTDDSFEDLEIEVMDNDETDVENEETSDPVSDRLIHLYLLFLFLWQSLFRISDAGLSMMLVFMKKFLTTLGTFLCVTQLSRFAKVFPSSLYRAKKFLGRLQERFVRYASCPTCHALYEKEYWWSVDHLNKQHPNTCTYVRFVGHRLVRMRAPCGSQIMKTVRTSNGTDYLTPIRTYCYVSVIKSLEILLNRPSILSSCELWRKRPIENGELCDVYDGKMWKAFHYDHNGEPFLVSGNNYLLMLNCDWFQPFKHTQYSLGVIYLCVQNLPRNLRFKRENVMNYPWPY